MSIVLVVGFFASMSAEDGASARWGTAGMTESRPAISYHEQGRPRLVMTCEGTQTNIQIRGFDAAQQWPQPTLSVRLGTVERADDPDLRMIGDQTAFSFAFPISDSFLDAFKDGSAITATYEEQTSSFPVAPPALREEFADKCKALVLPEMRNN
ncbi:hypothetical protein [Sphingosinicella sp. CPCC 101087]|uniref:hypothetical protein n=1 Tax=Sphingosinicella sp. CPCC 101087 TaxID=2497754 RepID=UPI00101CFE2B|nr:hypothetical protein [Sphingosinicella sp. CPCC 101087]